MRQIAFIFSVATCLISAQTSLSSYFSESECEAWPNHGRDLKNQRNAACEHKISPSFVRNLALKWKFYAGGDISATPSVEHHTVYFSSWNGFLYAVRFQDGSLLWKANLTKAISWTSSVLSRATPVVAGNLLIVGIYEPAILLAVDRFTGKVKWISEELDSSSRDLITMSGTSFKGAFYVGVSSLEELADSAACCTFQGSFQKFDLHTGKRIWRTSMLLDNNGTRNGYSGAAIWGSSPSIDVKRGLVYIATGNLYKAPSNIQACEDANANRTVPITPDPCFPSNVHEESILALYLKSGKIKWSKRLGEFDVWTLTCIINPSINCPSSPGPDYDFGEAPMLLSIHQYNGTKGHDILVAGQKSGVVWALDRDTGNVFWNTVAGPGGSGGGATWGSATDGHRIYTNIANYQQKNFTLAPSSIITTAGGWIGLNASTGQVLWSTANPTGKWSYGPVTIANGVLFAGSFDKSGYVYALDAKSGSILWNSTTNATVYGGFSIAHGCAFIGSGYNSSTIAKSFDGSSGNFLFAYCLH